MRNKQKTFALIATLLTSSLLPMHNAAAHDHWDDRDGPRDHGGPGWDHHGGPRDHGGPDWRPHRGPDFADFDHHRGPPPYAQREFYYRGHHFRPGGRYPHDYYQNRYWVSDWRDRGLDAPPSGHRWANIGGNYVLIAIASGVITSLILNN